MVVGFVFGGTAIAILWAWWILPLLFEGPHSTNSIPASNYYLYAAVYTAVALTVSGTLIFGALTSVKGATRLVVYRTGFEVHYGPTRKTRIEWSRSGFSVALTDMSLAARAHPRDFETRAGEYLLRVRSSGTPIWLPKNGFDAILASAAAADLEVRATAAPMSFPESKQYLLRHR